MSRLTPRFGCRHAPVGNHTTTGYDETPGFNPRVSFLSTLPSREHSGSWNGPVTCPRFGSGQNALVFGDTDALELRQRVAVRDDS
jgi:hypothetical protein